jgi:hypothetical protein
MPPATPAAEPSARPSTRGTAGRRLAGGLHAAGARLRGLRAGRGGERMRPAWLMGAVGAAWAAAIGLVVAGLPMLLVWMASPDSGLTWLESLRIAGLLWVVAHGVPVTVGAVTYSLVPWGLAIVPILLLGYAGSWAARRSDLARTADVLVLVGAGTLVYAGAVGVVAGATARPGSATGTLPAIAYSAVIALLSLGWGAARAAGVTARDLLPAWAVVVLRAGLIGAFTLLGIGALAATASLLAHVDDAITMTQALHPGFWGGLGLLAVNLAYVPVLAVWGMSYVLGAGVVIGPGITVSPFIAATTPTQLPPMPLLAALPQNASPLAWLLPVAGVVAGVLVGLSISRGARQEPRLVRLAMAAGAAAVSGLVVTLLAALGAGSLGDLRLAHVGAVPVAAGILAAVLVVLGAVPSAIVARPPARPRLTTAQLDDIAASVAPGKDAPGGDEPRNDDGPRDEALPYAPSHDTTVDDAR